MEPTGSTGLHGFDTDGGTEIDGDDDITGGELNGHARAGLTAHPAPAAAGATGGPGGPDDARAANGGPATGALPATGAPGPVPLTEDVRGVFVALAELLDGRVRDGMVEDTAAFARRHLKVTSSELVSHAQDLTMASFRLASRVLGRDIARWPPAEVAGLESDEPPQWGSLEIGFDDDGEPVTESVPSSLVAAFEAGTVAEVPLVVAVNNRWNEREITVYSRLADAGQAEQHLADVLRRGRGEANYLRGGCLRASVENGSVAFTLVPRPSGTREELVLPERVWEEIRTNVDNFFARRELLAEMGLGTNRGLLLAGAPGVGKTQLCKVLAAELAGQVTVVFADAAAMASCLNDLYEELVHLGPSLVVLEDIDLVVGSRKRNANPLTLNEFLTALDGVWSRHNDVVTVATTNDADGIDDAAKRAARFDTVVEVPLPDAAGRAAILERYLRRCSARVDVRRVAEAAGDVSGADLRELVRRTVLEYGDGFTTDQMLAVAGGGRWEPSTGQYL
ncbi:AAA family ATPase [Allostreptomyces psammosilenae]|uniref:AAA+ ATPase domain-containing protein n=1 Tax=Allostreptomyces psammosilenae TaxID=1892865 RepID=A0A852ZSR4_9ACTN|nr:ATP-binding protein [Allostreptomyces psammosilenae]NYI05443.1 hypothetical protein [Allostreptomyces psammosilenae]